MPEVLGAVDGNQVIAMTAKLTEELNRPRVKPRGFFVGTDENYKCLFFKDRTCHVREHIKITDENLREDTVVSENWDHAQRTIEDVPDDRLMRRHARNTADWLVSEFCRICPHKDR